MIILGTKVMASRPKHEWKTALACWNLMLSIFSFCGMIRTVPHLMHNVVTLPFKVSTTLHPFLPSSLPPSLPIMLTTRPLLSRLAPRPLRNSNHIHLRLSLRSSLPRFQDTICRHPAETYGEGACGMWVMLFIFSKVPELVDTVFIVFRKSKLQVKHAFSRCLCLSVSPSICRVYVIYETLDLGLSKGSEFRVGLVRMDTRRRKKPPPLTPTPPSHPSESPPSLNCSVLALVPPHYCPPLLLALLRSHLLHRPLLRGYELLRACHHVCLLLPGTRLISLPPFLPFPRFITCYFLPSCTPTHKTCLSSPPHPLPYSSPLDRY